MPTARSFCIGQNDGVSIDIYHWDDRIRSYCCNLALRCGLKSISAFKYILTRVYYEIFKNSRVEYPWFTIKIRSNDTISGQMGLKTNIPNADPIEKSLRASELYIALERFRGSVCRRVRLMHNFNKFVTSAKRGLSLWKNHKYLQKCGVVWCNLTFIKLWIKLQQHAIKLDVINCCSRSTDLQLYIKQQSTFIAQILSVWFSVKSTQLLTIASYHKAWP